MTMENKPADIKERIATIVDEFAGLGDWENRYRHIIKLGKELPEIEEQHRVDANKVKGCQSQVWLFAELKDKKIVFQADSDASIVKGIIALLLRVYSNSTPDDILMTKPIFLDDIGLKQHLSMSRANGLNSMVKQISIIDVPDGGHHLHIITDSAAIIVK